MYAIFDKIEFVECLATMYLDIARDGWPSQEKIDEAVGYAVVLGFPETEIDALGSALTR